MDNDKSERRKALNENDITSNQYSIRPNIKTPNDDADNGQEIKSQRLRHHLKSV